MRTATQLPAQGDAGAPGVLYKLRDPRQGRQAALGRLLRQLCRGAARQIRRSACIAGKSGYHPQCPNIRSPAAQACRAPVEPSLFKYGFRRELAT